MPMKTFIEHINEAALDKSRQPDPSGYTNGQFGQGQIAPVAVTYKLTCENYHKTESYGGRGSEVVTLVTHKQTGIVSLRWVCKKCKDQGKTPYVNQVQVGTWLASATAVE